MPESDPETAYISDSEPERELYHSQRRRSQPWQATRSGPGIVPPATGSKLAAKAAFPWSNVRPKDKGKGRAVEAVGAQQAAALESSSEELDKIGCEAPLPFELDGSTSTPSHNRSADSSLVSDPIVRSSSFNARPKRTKRSSGKGTDAFLSANKVLRSQLVDYQLPVEPATPPPREKEASDAADEDSPMRLDKVDVSRFRFSDPQARPNLFKRPSEGSASKRDSVASGSATDSSLASLAAPILELPQATLRRLQACPSCNVAWTTYRAPSVKRSHIAKCAGRGGLEMATILDRIREAEERQLQDKERKELEERRNMTAFDREVRNKRAEIRVVGVESPTGSTSAEDGGQEASFTTTQVQRELDGARKAKRTRKGVISPITAHPRLDDGLVKSFGSTQRHSVHEEARRLLADPAVVEEPMQVDVQPPPATQAFRPSRLANGQSGLGSLLAQPERKGLWDLAGDGDEDDRHDHGRSLYRSRPSTPPSPFSIPSASSASSPVSPLSARPFSTVAPVTLPSSSARSPTSATSPPRARDRLRSTHPNDTSPLSSASNHQRRRGSPQQHRQSFHEGVYEEGNSSAMPDYAAWTIEQLMAESERLGFGEPLKTKRALVKRAQDGWETKFAAISLVHDEPPVAVPSPPKPTPRSRSRSASSASSSSSVGADPDELVISDDEGSSAVDDHEPMPEFKRWPIAELRAAHAKLRYPSEPKTKEAFVRRLTKAWLEDRGRAAGPSSTAKGPGRATAETVDAGMRAVCVDDAATYEKILRYEPVKLSAVRAKLESLLGTDRIKSSLITQWLDRRSVTFYIEDPTRGKRPRH